MTLKKIDFHNVSKILGILLNLGPLFDRRRLSIPLLSPPSAQRESLEAKKRELGGKGGGKVVGGIKLKSPPGKRLV